MFNINHRPTFTIPVTVALEGIVEGQTLTTTFRAIPDEEAASFGIDAESLKAFLRCVIVDFPDLVDDGAAPVPYSDAVRDQVIDFTHMRLALNHAYWTALLKVRSGN